MLGICVQGICFATSLDKIASYFKANLHPRSKPKILSMGPRILAKVIVASYHKLKGVCYWKAPKNGQKLSHSILFGG